MCGIAGVIFCGRKSVPQSIHNDIVPVFSRMFVNAQDQGTDAAGIFHSKSGATNILEPQILIYKDKITATSMINNPKYIEAVRDAYSTWDTNFLVGHTRAATCGSARNNRNNHPFVRGSIIGVHNGGIHNHKELAKSLSNNTMLGECDSEIIFALLNHYMSSLAYTAEKAIKEVYKKLEGWYAVVAADSVEHNKIMLFRHRAPLSFKVSMTHKLILFASRESWIKEAWESRSKLHLTNDRLEDVYLPEDHGIIIDSWYDNAWPTTKVFSLEDKTLAEGSSNRNIDAAGDIAGTVPGWKKHYQV